MSYSYAKESDLTPYTESETKPTEDMETKDDTKELNLCELLADHIGERFYSPCYGAITLSEVKRDRIIISADINGKKHTLRPNGAHISGGGLSCGMLFPSVEFYRQYPLDAKKAWEVWQEEQGCKCRIWVNYTYNNGKVTVFNVNSVFRNSADRDKCIEEIRAIIEKYSKKWV